MLREKLLRDLHAIFESMNEDIWGFLVEEANANQIRIGLATYGQSGYKVVHDDNNPEIQNTLHSLYPQVARGSGFGKFEKTGPNSLGVTVPTGQQGAGGMGGFVSLCIFGSKDPNSLSKAARKVIDNNVVPQYRYALEKIANSAKLEETPMYHGSNVKFDKPKDGMIHWVTPSKELAQEYANGSIVHRGGGEPIVYEHDIDAKHPAIVDSEYSRITTLLSKWYENRPNKEVNKETILGAMNAIREKWHQIGLDNSDTAVYNHWNMTGVEGNSLLIKFLELLGYDSIYFKEHGQNTYGVWKF